MPGSLPVVRRGSAVRRCPISHDRTWTAAPTATRDPHGDRAGAGRRVAERGDEPERAEGPEAGSREREPAHREDPEQGAEPQGGEGDDDLERQLVVRPEQRDDEVLGAGRLQVDDALADRGHERGGARQQAADRSDTPRPRPADTTPASAARPRSDAGGWTRKGSRTRCSYSPVHRAPGA